MSDYIPLLGLYREAMSYEDWREEKRLDDEHERRRYTETDAGNAELVRLDMNNWPEMREKMLQREREWMD